MNDLAKICLPLAVIGLVTLVFALVFDWFDTVTMTIIGLSAFTSWYWAAKEVYDWSERTTEYESNTNSKRSESSERTN